LVQGNQAKKKKKQLENPAKKTTEELDNLALNSRTRQSSLK
jgi:hypothetical protein